MEGSIKELSAYRFSKALEDITASEVMLKKEFPASYYLVFFHPSFDYLKDNCEVMKQVENLAWNYDIEAESFNNQKYLWNEEVCQIYQRHYPEVLGYEVLRPVKRKQPPIY